MDLLRLLPTSVEGAIATFCTFAAAIIVGAAKISAAVENWKRRKRMKSVPPSDPAPHHVLARRLDTLERDVSLARAKWQTDELLARVGELEKTLAEVAGDQGRMAHSLAAERQRAQRAEARYAMEADVRRMLESRLSEALTAKEEAERERDAARAVVQELRGQR